MTIGHYDYISQFHVVRTDKNTDVILGQPWFKDLGTFLLNIKKQVLTFPYKGKMVMFRDITSKSKSIKSSLEDLKDISDFMFQDNKKTISKKQKELEKVICSKDRNFAPQISPRKTTRTSQESSSIKQGTQEAFIRTRRRKFMFKEP